MAAVRRLLTELFQCDAQIMCAAIFAGQISNASLRLSAWANCRTTSLYYPICNITPTTLHLAVRLNNDIRKREVVMMRWGLISFFARSEAVFRGFSTTNARAEGPESKALGQLRSNGVAAWCRQIASTNVRSSPGTPNGRTPDMRDGQHPRCGALGRLES